MASPPNHYLLPHWKHGFVCVMKRLSSLPHALTFEVAHGTLSVVSWPQVYLWVI